MGHKRIEVDPTEVERLAWAVVHGTRTIDDEPRPVVHAVIDRLDRDKTEGPYPHGARQIAEMVGYTQRSVTRQRARRRARQKVDQ